MPRKRKPEQPVNEVDTTATTITAEPPIETPAAQLPVEKAPVEPLPAEPLAVEQPQTFVDRVGEKNNRALRPDPFVIALDNVAGVRLFENRQARVMAIKFDEKPAQPVIDMVKDAGFRWNPADGVWTHPVRGDSAMATRIDAERLYQEVRQMIQQGKGVETGKDIPF